MLGLAASILPEDYWQQHVRLPDISGLGPAEWLIANGNEAAKEYSPQLANISVVGACTCGCPSIDLALQGRDQRKTAPSTILGDFVGTTAEGIEVGIILHAREGEISELEVYPIAHATEPFSLPTIESLKQF